MARRNGALDSARAFSWLAVSTRWAELQGPEGIADGARPIFRAWVWISSQSRFTHAWVPEHRESHRPALTIRAATVGARVGTSCSSGSGTREPPETQISGSCDGRGSIVT